MFNLDAPKDSIPYKIAKENKQLGWYFEEWGQIPSLDLLIFNTKQELEKEKYLDFYFDWELEISYLYPFISGEKPPLLNVNNIPLILQFPSFYSEFLPSIGLEIRYWNQEKGSRLYLTKCKEDVFQNFRRLEVEISLKLFSFLRYEYFYLKKYQKEILNFLMSQFHWENTLRTLDFKIDLDILKNKKNLNIFKETCNLFYQHNLLFLFKGDLPQRLEKTKEILNLKKKYSINIYSLISELQKIPSEKEIRDWFFKYQLNTIKERKISIFQNNIFKAVFGWEIIELVSHKDLLEEAKYQSNCLAGYTSYLDYYAYRFFSIRKEKIRVTCLFNEGTLKEAKGRFNKNLNTLTFNKEHLEEIEYIIQLIQEKIQEYDRRNDI